MAEVTDPAQARKLLAAVSLPLGALSLDFSGVVVALPSIGADLSVPTEQLGLVVNAFALGFAGPLLVAGRVADRYGRKRLLQLGLVIFAIGSATCGLAPTFGVLVIGRVVQGLATALFMTSSLSVISASLTGALETRGIGVWSAVGGAGSAAGPLVCGVLTDLASWRWFFAVNLPIVAVALALSRRNVPESKDPAAEPIQPAGAALSIGGMAALVLGLQLIGTHGITTPTVALSFAVFVACFAVLARMVRRSPNPPIDPAKLRVPGFRSSVWLGSLGNVGFGAFGFLLTLYIQDVLGHSPLQTGLAFLAYSVPFALVGVATGRILDRARPRVWIAVGLGLVAASFLALVGLGVDGPTALVLASFLLSGVGQGLVYNASTAGAMESIPGASAGVASGVLNAARNVAVVVGIALATYAVNFTDEFIDGLHAVSIFIAALSLVGLVVALTGHRPSTEATPA